MSNFKNCFTCKGLIEEVGDSTVLFCSCLVLLCQSCAKKDMTEHEGFLKNHITCPQCGAKTDVNAIQLDVQKVKDAEWALVTSGFAHYQRVLPSRKRIVKKNLDSIFPLYENEFEGFHLPYELNDESLDIAQCISFASHLEYKRLSKLNLTVHRGALKNPVDLITFASNSFMERVIMKTEQGKQNDFTVVTNCCACWQPIPEKAVLLTCSCVESNLCLNCAFEVIANQPTSYTMGIDCPQCKKSSHVISNIEAALKYETELISSAYAHFGERKESNEVQSLLKLYWLFDSIGVKGTMERDTSNKEYQVDYLRLEIARLEKAKQNREKLQNRSGECKAENWLGPLAKLTLQSHKFLDVFTEKIPAASKYFDMPKQPFTQNEHPNLPIVDILARNNSAKVYIQVGYELASTKSNFDKPAVAKLSLKQKVGASLLPIETLGEIIDNSAVEQEPYEPQTKKKGFLEELKEISKQASDMHDAYIDKDSKFSQMNISDSRRNYHDRDDRKHSEYSSNKNADYKEREHNRKYSADIYSTRGPYVERQYHRDYESGFNQKMNAFEHEYNSLYLTAGRNELHHESSKRRNKDQRNFYANVDMGHNERIQAYEDRSGSAQNEIRYTKEMHPSIQSSPLKRNSQQILKFPIDAPAVNVETFRAVVSEYPKVDPFSVSSIAEDIANNKNASVKALCDSLAFTDNDEFTLYLETSKHPLSLPKTGGPPYNFNVRIYFDKDYDLPEKHPEYNKVAKIDEDNELFYETKLVAFSTSTRLIMLPNLIASQIGLPSQKIKKFLSATRGNPLKHKATLSELNVGYNSTLTIRIVKECYDMAEDTLRNNEV